jgi:hypothetical protein
VVWRAGERQIIGTAREPVTLNVMQALCPKRPPPWSPWGG